MRAGEDERTAPFERALLFRDGLIIALWSLLALRIATSPASTSTGSL